MEHLTIEKIAEAMMGDGLSFKDVYLPELSDCVDELANFITRLDLCKKLKITKKEQMANGYNTFYQCLKEGPSREGFGRGILECWIRFFFEYPDLMELVGIIAEQENPNADPEVVKEMRNFKTEYLVTKSDKKGVLTGMKVVFTGASSHFKGEDMERWLEKNGASTSHTVTVNTELLITGKRPSSSKLAKAKGYGIKVITEDEFIRQFKDKLVAIKDDRSN